MPERRARLLQYQTLSRQRDSRTKARSGSLILYQGEERISNPSPRRGADQISYTKVRNGSRLLYQSYRSGSRRLYRGWITSPVPRLGPVPKVDHSSCSKTRIGEWLGVNHVSPTKAGSRLLYQDLEWSASPFTRLGMKHVSC